MCVLDGTYDLCVRLRRVLDLHQDREGVLLVQTHVGVGHQQHHEIVLAGTIRQLERQIFRQVPGRSGSQKGAT